MAYPGLWLCGPPGVGKSTVGYEIFVAIHRTGRKAAYVDADQVGMCYPAPNDDPHNHTLKALNVAAVWRNFRAADAQCLIVSGAIRSEEDSLLYREQLADVSLLVCRLSVGGTSSEPGLRFAAWLTDRHYPVEQSGAPSNPNLYERRSAS